LNKIPKEIIPFLKVNERIPVSKILLDKNLIDKKYFLSERAIIGIKNKSEKSKKNGNGFGAQFLKLDKPSYTIPSRYWKDGYDALVKYNEIEIRRLTILELKRIQSFPDNYILEGSNKDVIIQIGNAVPPKFSYHLANFVKNYLT
jgi:DNA (cytosine-5)-methyltransferase 1